MSENKDALHASYRISYRLAKAGEAHTVAENLIKPCAKDLVECMIDKKYVKNIDKMPLSNSSVSRCIHALSNFCETELIRRAKMASTFSLQMDESTDVAGLAVLLVFVRYIYEGRIEEDLLIKT